MDDDSKVLIEGEFKNDISASARRAAKDIDDLGDQADQTAAAMAAMGAATDDAGDEMAQAAAKARLLEQRIKKLEGAAEKQTTTIRNLKAEQYLLNKELDKTRRSGLAAIPILGRLFNSFGGGSRKVNKGTGSLNKFWGILKKVLALTARITLITTAFSFLSRAVAGLGAAAIAGVNGLAPLTGLLVAYPGYLSAIVSSFAAFKLGTSGLGNAIKVLGDPAATAEDIEAATKNMAQSQITFARAVVDSKEAFIDLKKAVGGAFFEGLDMTYRNLVRRYLPVANKYLVAQADVWNDLLKSAGKYLDTVEAQSLISNIWEDNIYETDQFGRALGNLGLTIAYLVQSAGPMLRRMSRDFRDFSGGLLGSTRNNQSGLTNFFNASYDTFLGVKKTLTFYVKGLINIIDYSDALTNYIGNKLTNIGRNFLDFTESESGEKRIRQFFRDSRGTVKELGLWVRDIAKALMDLTMNNDDFLSASKALRTKLLPVIVDVLDSLSSQVVPLVSRAAAVYSDLKKSRVIGGLVNVAKGIGRVVEAFANVLANAPGPVKALLGGATTAGAAYSLFAPNFLKDAVSENLKDRVLDAIGPKDGIQKVFVVNMIPGMGGAAGPGVVGGGAAGAAGRTGLFARIGGGAKSLGGKMFGRGFGLAGLATSAALLLGAGAIKGDSGGSGFAKGALQGAALGRFFGPWGALIGTGIGGLFGGINGQSRSYQERVGVPVSGNGPSAILNNYDVLSRQIAELKGSGIARYDRNNFKMTGEPTRLMELRKELRGLNQDMKNLSGVSVNEWRNMSDAARQAALKTQRATRDLRAAAIRAADPFGSRFSRGRNMGKEAQIDSMTNTRGDKANSYKVGRADASYQVGRGIIERMAIPQVKQLGGTYAEIKKRLDAIPPVVVSKIQTPGALNSIRDVMKLKKQFDLQPPQVETLLKLLGTEEANRKIAVLRQRLQNIKDEQVNVRVQANVDKITSRLLANGQNPYEFLYTGGETLAGRKYVTGELGPEMWLGRNGQMKMLGLNGPELVAPGSGAVIPASATSDPWNGNVGKAPSWAINAYRQAMQAGQGVTNRPLPASRRPSGGSGQSIQISAPIGPIYATRDVDVTNAVQKGIQKAMREAEERQ